VLGRRWRWYIGETFRPAGMNSTGRENTFMPATETKFGDKTACRDAWEKETTAGRVRRLTGLHGWGNGSGKGAVTCTTSKAPSSLPLHDAFACTLYENIILFLTVPVTLVRTCQLCDSVESLEKGHSPSAANNERGGADYYNPGLGPPRSETERRNNTIEVATWLVRLIRTKKHQRYD
jgi:hypothetical protein